MITSGLHRELWFTVMNGNAIASAPACALGLSASISDDTLTTSFDLGVTETAVLTITAGSNVILQKDGPPVVPPKQFSLKFPFSGQGNVTITSTLANSVGRTQCSEWTTVNTE